MSNGMSVMSFSVQWIMEPSRLCHSLKYDTGIDFTQSQSFMLV